MIGIWEIDFWQLNAVSSTSDNYSYTATVGTNGTTSFGPNICPSGFHVSFIGLEFQAQSRLDEGPLTAIDMYCSNRRWTQLLHYANAGAYGVGGKQVCSTWDSQLQRCSSHSRHSFWILTPWVRFLIDAAVYACQCSNYDMQCIIVAILVISIYGKCQKLSSVKVPCLSASCFQLDIQISA